jgi:hypothetical protein
MAFDVYVHDGQIHRVVEDTERDTLTIHAELPVSAESDNFVGRLMVFQDAYG